MGRVNTDSTRLQKGGRQDPEARKLSIAKRINPVTGKSSLSFIDRNGETRFIERECAKCAKLGKKLWDFDFDCRNDQKSKSFVIEYATADTIHRPGPSGKQAVHTFSYESVDPNVCAEAEEAYIDLDFDSQAGDSENETGSQ
jgi:hypothetical protein